jgi:uncharacterized membrane protein YgcG
MNHHRVIPAKAGISVSGPSARTANGDSRLRGNQPVAWLRSVVALALVVLLAALALPATAAETINTFTSNVTLLEDGSVDVTEIIEVNAEGFEIRRGIFRDIPTFLINDDGSRLRASLDVVSVERDGRAEPYTVESIDAGFIRIRIGDADVFLTHGAHRYTIHYTMSRMGRTFADHDELYWNATGNYWSFPILRSVTNITLPQGAVIENLAGYTGKPGSTEQAVTVNKTSDNTATIRATRELAPGEGVTVAAAFQKGILLEPTDTQRLVWWLSDHRDLILPLVAVALVLLYNLFAWGAVGRDPAKGTIIPLFYPPKGFSPALVHFIHRMGWESTGWTAFTASIFNLGVKGLVQIDNAKKTLKVTVTGKEPAEPLAAGEQVIFDYLKSKGTVVVNTTNGPTLNTKRGEFVRAIESENRETYFKNNVGYIAIGALLSIASLGVLVLLDILPLLFLIIAVVAGIFIGLFAGLAKVFWAGNLARKFIFIVWGAILLFNFGGVGLNLFDNLRFNTAALAAVSIVIVEIVFAILMRAPTVQGRKVMDQIDGFKMYLETAEERRLNFEGAPPMTVERFEAILPYAIALKVEKLWSEHFDAELKRNAVEGVSGTYQPSFYRGTDWSSSRGGFSNTVAAATSGMAAAMIAAQPVSSSSSGFSGGGGGGGGSSGGGGGGGGGGGW